MWFEPKSGQTRDNAHENYSRNAEEKLEVVKYAEKHSNAAAVKHYDIDESNIRYWRKQKLSYSGLCELILKAWTESSAETIINGFLKACITDKNTTIEIAAEDESGSDDIATDTETLPDELMDMIDRIRFSSESESDLLDN